MFGVLSQYALLNQARKQGFLIKCANVINSHFTQEYDEEKINSIVAGVIKKRAEGTLEPYFNKERKIIFNPEKKITSKEKQKITAVLMGKIKTDKTQKSINDVIDDWDFQIDGKITQEKIANKLDKSLATIKRNWSPFKELVSELNNSFKTSLNSSIKEESSEVFKIYSDALIANQTEEAMRMVLNQYEGEIDFMPESQNSTMTLDKFISNCKCQFGSYIDDKRFDTLKRELEEICELKLMSDATEEIKNYINSQIDYPNEDGYYIKLELLK